MAGIVYALIASIIWGVNYAIAERTYKQVSVFTSLSIDMFLGSIICFMLGQNVVISDVKKLMADPKLLNLFIAGCVCYNAAMILIAKSIQASNATIAGLIEICYPFFTIIAAYILFNDYTLTLPVIIGGLLILAGILVIMFFGN